MKFFLFKITHYQMKKISSESAAVPTVCIYFGYFIRTKFLFFIGEIYMNFFQLIYTQTDEKIFMLKRSGSSCH